MINDELCRSFAQSERILIKKEEFFVTWKQLITSDIRFVLQSEAVGFLGLIQ